MIPLYLDTEFLRPLVTSWLERIKRSQNSQARTKWQEVVDECLMFYNRSAHAMWDPTFSRKVWANVKAPKFRFTANKAYELVAVFGPNLLWSVPHRQVEPKMMYELPEEVIANHPQLAALWQQLAPMQQQSQMEDEIIASLMETSLNYFSREQPGGGLGEHSKRCVTDALLMGRGMMVSRPYKFPGSPRQLVGSFHEDPRHLYLDPDFKTARQARWIAIKHIEPWWEVEKRFQLPEGSLRGRATLESTWSQSELATQTDGGYLTREQEMAGDLIVWYEIWSKSGCGSSRSGMPGDIKNHLEKVCGQYAYLAISPNVPFPLNCPTEYIRKGKTDEEIKRHFAWPIPLWADDRWPIELLDFYCDPDGPYPVPPLGPGMGELKVLNVMLPWLANRIHNSSRDFWMVADAHVQYYTQQLQEADDLAIIGTPRTVDDVRKAAMVMQQPETRADAWNIVEKVSETFDKRVGLTEFAYGRNEGGTQDRSAETTLARARAVGVRPEHMQNMVVDWQSNVASLEAILARTFVKGNDIAPLLGPTGQFLWDRYVVSNDIDRSTRQMSFTVAASSIRRPNRERAANNFSNLLNTFSGILQTYAQDSGDYQPINALIRKFGELNDFDIRQFELQPPEPDPEQQQMQQQQIQFELQKMEAELQKMLLEIQAKRIDAASRQQQMQGQAQQQQQGLQLDQIKFSQDFQQDQAKHLLDMVQQQQKHAQTLKHAAQQARQQRKLKRQDHKARLESRATAAA